MSNLSQQLVDHFLLGTGLFIRWFGQFGEKAAPILVDEFAIEADALTKLVLAIEGVEKVGRVRSRWIGDTASVDMIIYVAYDLTTEESHAICDLVESAVALEFNVKDVSVHVEPFHD